MKKTFAIAALPLAIALGGAIQLGRPVPAAAITVAPGELKLPGQFRWQPPRQGQAAIGEQGLGLIAATPNQEPQPIASLAKVMTAYLLLQARPLRVGQDGPVTTITAKDVAQYEHDVKLGYSVAKVRAGDKLTQRQLLEALMLPSADNVATLLAQQLAGSEEAFVRQMNAAAKALGMTQTHYADASGVSAETVSTAADQLKLAQVAMADRTFREVVAMPQTTLPTAGTVYNVNFMVGKQGVSGVKTGSTLAAGSCFVGSYPVTIGGKPRLVLAAVLGQVSLREAITYDVAQLHAAAPQLKEYALTAVDRGAAKLEAPWTGPVALAPAKPVKVFGYPGMPVRLSAGEPAALPIPLGRPVAELTIGTGDARQAVALHAGRAIAAPGMWWRLSH